MSYILDALKKTEQEKARKARGNGISGMTGALFDEAPARTRPFAGWKVAALVVILAMAITFAGTWFALRPSRPVTVAVPKPATPVVVPVAATPSPALPPAPAPAASPSTPAPLPPVGVTPALRPAPQTAPIAVAPVKPPPTKPAVQNPSSVRAEAVKPASEDAALQLTMQELGKRTAGRKLTADQIIAPPADVVLSGIAWQEERRARRAVVNGFLMGEGGFVSGARIVEIYQDRVRFSMSGKFFELNLVSAAAPTPGR